MAVFLEGYQGTIKYFVWQITEPLEYLVSNLSPQEIIELSQIQVIEKKCEYAAVRNLLQFIASKEHFIYEPIQKNENGKPFLPTIPLEISISHAFPFVAVAFAPKPLGIDIEEKKEKIRKVAQRVFSEKELSFAHNNLDYLAQLWTAKEALYKAYSRKGIAFRENIICDFCPEKQVFCKGWVKKEDFFTEYTLYHHSFTPTHHLCIAF
jgi:phosphopantetheine--protein transferase-like protein